MKQHKSKKLQIVIVIILLLILIFMGIFSYLYFFTDIFKNDKERFFRYASQIVSTKNGFIGDSLQEYLNKQNETAYENSGSVKFNISIPNKETELEQTNNFNISYEGKYDKPSNKEENNISLNYSDDVQFPLSYRKVGDLVAIQTKYIGKNYVGININDNQEENSNLANTNTTNSENTSNTANSENNVTNEEVVEEQNADISELKQKYDNIQNLKITGEELTNLYNNYISPIKNQLSDDKFSKIEENGTTGYKLSLTSDDVKNISKTALETLKADEELIKKINNYLTMLNNRTTKISKSIIEKQINNIDSLNEEAEIVLYETKGQLTNINIKIGESTITVSKTDNNSEVTYNLIGQIKGEQEKNINISVKFAGLDTMQNINETYEIKLETPYVAEENETQKLSIDEERECVETLVADAKSERLLNGQDANTITDTDIENRLNARTNENYANMQLEMEEANRFSITFINTNHQFIIDNTGKIIEEPTRRRGKYRRNCNNI